MPVMPLITRLSASSLIFRNYGSIDYKPIGVWCFFTCKLRPSWFHLDLSYARASNAHRKFCKGATTEDNRRGWSSRWGTL